MLTKKKRRMIKITIPVIISILLIAIVVLLYLKTDMFKSDETLFFKYLGKNFENISNIQDMLENEQISNLLKSDKYEEYDEISANYIQNYGTTSENTDNIINKLKLKIDQKIDQENNYKDYNIELSNQDEKNFKVEILKNEDLYQIYLPDILDKSLEVEDIDYLFEKIGFQNENIESIINLDIFENLKFNEEELETLKNKYIDLIKIKTENNKFSKRSNQKIFINNKEFTANEYTLTMTKEEYNILYMDILNELKNDEIILNKLEKMQEIYDLGLQNIKSINLKELYLNWIEETIDNINRMNIGTDETKIIIYEAKGKTISTIVETSDYEIDFDNIFEDEKFSEITFKEKDEKSKIVTISKNGDTNKFAIIENKTMDESNTFEIEEKNIVENNNFQKNTTIKYEDKTNKIEVKCDKKMKQVNNVDIKDISQDTIKIKELKEKQLDSAIKTIKENVLKRISEVSQNVNIGDDIQKILKNIGFKKEVEQIISEGISESEKNRYNSRFEILKGENIEGKEISKIIDSIKDNIINLEVESNVKLKIKISSSENNEDLVNKLQDVINKNKNKNKKYNVDVEYNNESGLVEYVVLEIIEDKR